MMHEKGQDPPILAMSVVLFHSDLGRFERLLVSLTNALRATRIEQAVMVCVDHSLDEDYSKRARSLCSGFQGVAGLTVDWVTASANPGYGAGHNAALARVHSRYHLLLNPDVELEINALCSALDAFEQNPNAALLSPVGRSDSGSPAYLAKAYPNVWVLALRAFGPNWLKRLNAVTMARYEMRECGDELSSQEIELASGCCMWVRRDLLDKVGGFDESYFLYFEDYDLSMKLAKHGQLLEHRSLRITHHGGNAASKSWRHVWWFAQGAARFFHRWGWRWFG